MYQTTNRPCRRLTTQRRTEMRWGKAAPGCTLESSEHFAGRRGGEESGGFFGVKS